MCPSSRRAIWSRRGGPARWGAALKVLGDPLLSCRPHSGSTEADAGGHTPTRAHARPRRVPRGAWLETPLGLRAARGPPSLAGHVHTASRPQNSAWKRGGSASRRRHSDDPCVGSSVSTPDLSFDPSRALCLSRLSWRPSSDWPRPHDISGSKPRWPRRSQGCKVNRQGVIYSR